MHGQAWQEIRLQVIQKTHLTHNHNFRDRDTLNAVLIDKRTVSLLIFCFGEAQAKNYMVQSILVDVILFCD